MLFTIKYAPQNSSQIVGQQKVIMELKDFIQNYRKQKKKAALLYGPIGTGKTSSVYALAQELQFDLLELNSSDLRNEKEMGSFLNSALGQHSLFFRPKIILVDEIDNVSGVKDRGAVSAVVKAIEKSSFPVILTANDPFDSKFKSLQKCCLMLEFAKLDYSLIGSKLKTICDLEQIKFEDKAINTLARQVDGDLRAALIDLQICSEGNNFSFVDLASLSDRKRTESILQALTLIFKSSTVSPALSALDNIDLDLNEVFLWIDENLPKEYLTPDSLSRAYEHLARADVFNGRIRRSQHWRFLVYINNLLTAGISSAKESKNSQFIQYKPTMRILKLWQAKMKNAKKKEIASRLALKTHTSQKRALEQIPYFQSIFQKGHGEKIALELELSEEETEWLSQ